MVITMRGRFCGKATNGRRPRSNGRVTAGESLAQRTLGVSRLANPRARLPFNKCRRSIPGFSSFIGQSTVVLPKKSYSLPSYKSVLQFFLRSAKARMDYLTYRIRSSGIQETASCAFPGSHFHNPIRLTIVQILHLKWGIWGRRSPSLICQRPDG